MKILSVLKRLLKLQQPAASGAQSARRPRVVFSYYTPEGAQISMPLTLLSGLLQRDFPEIDRSLLAINRALPEADHSVEWYRNRIEQLQPDLLAISCMSAHWKEMREYLGIVREVSPKTRILIGGYQAILAPDETIAHPAVDMICVGDGEKPLADLAARLMRTGDAAIADTPIAGLWEKMSDGTVSRQPRVLTEDLNAYPFPDYSIFEKDGSLRNLGISLIGISDKLILPVMSGRGCPYKCTYCSNTSLLEMYKGEGSYIRKYDIDRLIEELANLRQRYDVEYFEFWDELFMVNVRYARAFFLEYKKRIGLPFAINARVERMDEPFCRAARDAGCHTIWFGIESGSESYREKWLNRKMRNDDVLRAAENARQCGIQRLTFNIVGMPFETREDAEQTLALNRAIAPEFFYFFTYLPLEGTALYKVAWENDLLLSDDSTSSRYLEGLHSNQFRMNLRHHSGGMTADEFSDVCQRMAVFMGENNRLAY